MNSMDTEITQASVSSASDIVRVRRQPGHWRLADYRLSDVSRMRWGYIGGGLRRRTQWHVYGFVMCDAMVSGKLGHSCKHGPPPHRIKVCITKKYNEKIWPKIAEKVGPKPIPRRQQRRMRRKMKQQAATARV
jgi:hypothetical protein